MKYILYSLVAVAVAACASKTISQTPDARKDLEERYAQKVGVATKHDLTQEFGAPAWCRNNPSGEETCRFYKKIGTKWMGDKKDRTNYEQFDEVVAEFDSNGVMRSFKSNAQR